MFYLKVALYNHGTGSNGTIRVYRESLLSCKECIEAMLAQCQRLQCLCLLGHKFKSLQCVWAVGEEKPRDKTIA